MPRHRKKPPTAGHRRIRRTADLPQVPVVARHPPVDAGAPSPEGHVAAAKSEPEEDRIRRMIEAAYT